jgi:hypothetical protein
MKGKNWSFIPIQDEMGLILSNVYESINNFKFVEMTRRMK